MFRKIKAFARKRPVLTIQIIFAILVGLVSLAFAIVSGFVSLSFVIGVGIMKLSLVLHVDYGTLLQPVIDLLATKF